MVRGTKVVITNGKIWQNHTRITRKNHLLFCFFVIKCKNPAEQSIADLLGWRKVRTAWDSTPVNDRAEQSDD